MKKQFIAVSLAVVVSASLLMAGCGSSDTETKTAKTSVTFDSEAGSAGGQVIFGEDSEALSEESAASSENETTANAETAETGSSESDIFSKRDLTQEADTSAAETITVSDGEDITISEAGIYVITGTASDATVIVETDDEAKVQLVLDNVNITNEDSPAIYVKNADKVFITTAEGSENTLTVTGTLTADGTTNIDGVIFSKDDLTLNGLGTLTVNSTAHGIVCKDDLKATGGTWVITAAKKGIEANDSISVCDGSFTITAGTDGFHCENDEDNTLGSVYISGGSFNIDAKSDGIQATTTLEINGGTLDISAEEGLEATKITIGDGTINIEATDDGINASQKSTSVDVLIEFYGGSTTITMGRGDTDAVDSNGYIYVYDGTITISGMSAFDYERGGAIYGGTVTVNGEQITEMTTQMMGGGMMGGRGQFGDGTLPDGTAPDGTTPDGTAPEAPEGMTPGQGGMYGGFGAQGQRPGRRG